MDKYFQVGVVRHRFAQRFGDVDELVFMWLVAPRPYFAGQNFVGEVAFKCQFALK